MHVHIGDQRPHCQIKPLIYPERHPGPEDKFATGTLERAVKELIDQA